MKLAGALRDADRALFRIGKSIEILDKLRWKESVRNKFLQDWRRGKPSLPKPVVPKYQFDREKETLRSIAKISKQYGHLGTVIEETALSFLTALRMLESVGTKRFLRLSVELYGQPTDTLTLGNASTLRAATRFLKAAQRFRVANILPAESYCVLPETVAKRVRTAARRVFYDKEIKVITTGKLISKASAGPRRVRIRNTASFAAHDIAQLIQHELLVHTLTLINGRRQKLRVLGLNSPRTTTTQEGLAVFAEFITNAIDVSRLRRISARVRAIQMGLDGADFLDLFHFFLNQGQDELEAYYSSVRIFRGGNTRGSIVFTKDVVYLRGFIEVHHFFLSALEKERYLHPHYLFAGRLRTDDIKNLEEYFEAGILASPHYEPDWIQNRSTLLAFLLSSSVMNDLGLSKVR